MVCGGLDLEGRPGLGCVMPPKSVGAQWPGGPSPGGTGQVALVVPCLLSCELADPRSGGQGGEVVGGGIGGGGLVVGGVDLAHSALI